MNTACTVVINSINAKNVRMCVCVCVCVSSCMSVSVCEKGRIL